MRASDIFFLPSEREGVALSVYEAMATGLAVIASDVGGQAELVTADTGVLVAPGDDEAAVERFAKALSLMIQSPSLRASIGHEARKRVTHAFASADLAARINEMLGRAKAARDAAPRSAVDQALAAAIAEQAVEYLRLDSVCDRLWHEREADADRAGRDGRSVDSPTGSVFLGRLNNAYIRLRALVSGWRRNGVGR
jgi:hypothetical protein